MAVTSIWPVKSRVKKVIDYARNPEKTKEESLERLADFHQIDGVLEYAADDMKTEERSYVTCIGCREETAAEQFMETKRTWSAVSGMDKSLGRVCYHGYQSFAKGEVTAEMAHEIGVKLAERLWGDRYEVLVATHCNTDHYHNHFVINSVSHVDGIKFRNTHADYRAMREASDRLCLEYGISMIEEPERRGKNYGEYLAEANGKPTVRGFIRNDIDAAIRSSITVREFIGHLSVMGYEMKFYNEKGKELKYPALKPMGAKGFFRFHNLGQGYSLEEIKERIQRNKRRVLPFPEEEREAVRRYRLSNPPRRKLTGLKALYYNDGCTYVIGYNCVDDNGLLSEEDPVGKTYTLKNDMGLKAIVKIIEDRRKQDRTNIDCDDFSPLGEYLAEGYIEGYTAIERSYPKIVIRTDGKGTITHLGTFECWKDSNAFCQYPLWQEYFEWCSVKENIKRKILSELFDSFTIIEQCK